MAEPTADRAKLRVALISLGTAVAIFAFKLAAGLHARSLGILAEAAHSALDLLATLLTWISLRVAARPADANHPFGHGKVETFAAFLESGLLVATAAAIATMAIGGWVHGVPPVRPDAWAFAVMLASIAVDWRRAAMLRRAARQYGSEALAADALNFSSDLAGSLAVLVGLAAVWVGQRWHLPELAHADALAGCVVAAGMLWLALRLGRRTAGALLDEAPPGLSRDLRAALQGVEGVDSIERLRLRNVGSRYFVDLQLGLEPVSTLERAGLAQQEVTRRIRRRLPGADVVVEAHPRPQPPGMLERVQAVAHEQNLRIHDLSIYDLGTGLDMEFHLELPESLPLAEAHVMVSALEREMRRQVPGIRQIVAHIEPEASGVNIANLLDSDGIAHRVEQLAGQVAELLDCHDIQLRRANGHLALSCHCTFPDGMAVGRVHELISRLELALRREIPELFRVTIHPEPGSDNRG